VFVPSSYRQGTPMPLVVLLHGYTASGAIQETYYRLQPLAESRGFLYVHPDGTIDRFGNHFWNATDACCDLGGKGVDDVTYLTAIIDQVSAKYSVDPKRVYLIGHSNGGFMSYRMACDRSDRIAAIVSLAGATFADTSRCAPGSPVSVLQIHGTADGTIQYTGGSILGHAYPSAETSVATWAAYDGCTSTLTPTSTKLDLVSTLAGKESSVATYDGCRSGASVQLWTVQGGAHVPVVSTTLMPDVLDFLFAHPKP
jgi:polyhydroxybutyrate depolymerase